MRKLLLILLLPTVCFGGRKLTLGFDISGRTYTGSSYHNGDGATFTQFFGHEAPGYAFLSGYAAGGYHGTSVGIEAEGYPFYGGAATGNVYAKMWVRLSPTLPSQNVPIFFMQDNSGISNSVGFQWNSTGRISITINGIARDSTASGVTTGSYVLVKMWTSGSYTELNFDGNIIIDSTHSFANPLTNIGLGFWATQTGLFGVNRYVIFEDLVINDQSGSYENSAPDDSSRIFVMPPDSDVAINGWRGGSGGTTNLYNAVANYTSTRNLGNTAETDNTQIVDTTNSATDNIDFALTAINSWQGTAANDTVPENLTVRFAQAFVRHGEHDSAGSKLGSVQLISNPAAPSETGFTFGDNAQNSLHGGTHDIDYGDRTHGTAADSLSWRTTFAAPIYWPTITRTSKSVIRIGKRTATSLKVDVDAVGMIIEVGHANTAVTSTIWLDDD